MSTHKTHDTKRESILTAATKVAREGGLRAMNARAIATEARTSPATVLYYFQTMDELINRAISRVMDQFYVDRSEHIAHLESPITKLSLLIEMGVPDKVAEEMRIVYEVSANLTNYPQFGTIVRAIHEKQLEMYLNVIEEGVSVGLMKPLPDSLTVARNLLAIEDTYDFYPLIGIDVPRKQLRQNLRSYAEVSLNCHIPNVT
jgi:AcrR family transcriptional regulator